MIIRTMKEADLDAVLRIERRVWGEAGAGAAEIASRARHCPEGSIVALRGDEIVGYAAAQVVGHISTGSWAEQTDNGTIARSHLPEGRIAYGVNMSALPEAAHDGLAGHVIEHYRQIFLVSGRCDIMVLGSRLPGFARWSAAHGQGGLATYLRPGPDGRYRDPELRLYNKAGFSVLWGLPDYFPDSASADAGAMIARTG